MFSPSIPDPWLFFLFIVFILFIQVLVLCDHKSCIQHKCPLVSSQSHVMLVRMNMMSFKIFSFICLLFFILYWNSFDMFAISVSSFRVEVPRQKSLKSIKSCFILEVFWEWPKKRRTQWKKAEELWVFY